jgi:hypothetical protein
MPLIFLHVLTQLEAYCCQGVLDATRGWLKEKAAFKFQ